MQAMIELQYDKKQNEKTNKKRGSNIKRFS